MDRNLPVRLIRFLKGRTMRLIIQHVSVLLARILLSLFFLWNGANLIGDWVQSSDMLGGRLAQVVGEAVGNQGVALAHVILLLEVFCLLVGGLLLLVGFRGRLAAFLLILFLVPDTLVLHSFWTVDPANVLAYTEHLTHFLKNVGLLGGLLLVMGFGSGGFSVDLLLGRRRRTEGF
jgi:putative oxidoreductase